MVHDFLPCDNWYHEFANHLCVVGNDLRIFLRDANNGDLSIEELKIELVKDIDRIEKIHAIIQEVYIDTRRKELAEKDAL